MRFPETLRTPRLTLRPLTDNDLPVLVREIGRWEVARWLISVPHPYTEAHGRGWLEVQRARRRSFTLLHYAVVPDGWREMAGAIALDLDRADGAGQGEENGAEMGYWLAPAAWGRGYGTEMVRAMLACAFGPVGLDHVQAAADPENHASNAVLRKAGLVLERVDPLHSRGLRGDPGPANIHRITRARFEALHEPA
ncbi:MAG: hypothetical protein RLY86_1410 [Pseudomonadota bacterium]